jgi:hypothetical protein
MTAFYKSLFLDKETHGLGVHRMVLGIFTMKSVDIHHGPHRCVESQANIDIGGFCTW